MRNGNRSLALLAYADLTVTALLLMMALLRIYTAGLDRRVEEEDSLPRLVCQANLTS